MKMNKNLQLKLAFCIFSLLFVFAFSGAVSARAVVEDVTITPLVVETGETFNGSTAIQDAIDDEDTIGGYHIQLEPVYYLEQITVTKDLTISGVTSYPTDTNIGYDTADGVFIIPSGVSVVLENMAIWTRDENAPTITNTGQLTLINCMLNGVYYEYNISGTVETIESSLEYEVTDTDVMLTTGGTAEVEGTVEEPVTEEPAVEEPVTEEPVTEEPVTEEPVTEEPVTEEPVTEEPVTEEPVTEEPAVEEPVTEEPVTEEPVTEEPVTEEPAVEEPVTEEPAVEEPVTEEPAVEEPVTEEPVTEEPAVEEPAVEEPVTEGTTGTSGTETSTSTETTDTEDPSVPLASLASGMLMVMGGTMISRKK
ncbi:MAG: hypothetical protein KO316_09750 [Methanobacterium sp.]|nr:hypothetical protein [Methanobacterium sp.]